MIGSRRHGAPLTPSMTTAPVVVVDKATGVCVTTKPVGVPLLKGNDSTFDFNPLFCSSATAADWERPTKFGTMTVENTLDVVELELELTLDVDGSGEVDVGLLAELGGALVDAGSVCPLRTSATIATMSAATAMTIRRSGRRVCAVPSMTRALKTRNPTKMAATIPATRPVAKVTATFLRRRGLRRSAPRRPTRVPSSTLRSR
jgi:hypothetical protein